MEVIVFIDVLNCLIDCCTSRYAARLRRVDFVFDGGMGDVFVCDSYFQDNLPVALLDMYDAESMNFVAA